MRQRWDKGAATGRPPFFEPELKRMGDNPSSTSLAKQEGDDRPGWSGFQDAHPASTASSCLIRPKSLVCGRSGRLWRPFRSGGVYCPQSRLRLVVFDFAAGGIPADFPGPALRDRPIDPKSIASGEAKSLGKGFSNEAFRIVGPVRGRCGRHRVQHLQHGV